MDAVEISKSSQVHPPRTIHHPLLDTHQHILELGFQMEDLGPSCGRDPHPPDHGHQRPGWGVTGGSFSAFSHCFLRFASGFHSGTKRTVRMDHTFFPSYRKTLLAPEEILLSIEIPYSRQVSCSGTSRITLTLARLQTRRPESALGTNLSIAQL